MSQSLENHIRRLDRRIAMLNRASERLMQWRLGAFFAGVVLVFAGLAVDQWVGAIALVVAFAGFMWVVRIHRRVRLTSEQFRGLRQIKATHLARQTLDWEHLPSESALLPENHPFALDIDVIGQFSLHRLLDTTVSIGGDECLQGWLLQTEPQLDEVLKRQNLVKELIPLTSFRDRLTLYARLQANKWDGAFLLRWLNAESAADQIAPRFLLFLWLLCLITLSLFFLSAGFGLPPFWGVSFVIYVVLGSFALRKFSGSFSEAMSLQSNVERLYAVFRYLEQYPFRNQPGLRAFTRLFREERPSSHLNRIRAIVSALSFQGNAVVWFMLNLAVPWDMTFVYLLGQSRGQLAAVLPGWLTIWYELEALSSLATFAYLNPSDTFPEIAPDTLFVGEGLGHPLIRRDACVRNDFKFDELGQIVLVTGSNMSGKSTFLRTLGLNLVLAYAGTTTYSQRLLIGQFRLFTSIRVSDSVVDGFSYFYAEVRRLKALLDALHESDSIPLFFLIDEIFRGTNNRERLIGSRSYIQALAGGNGLGLISTHDLELVKLEDVSNYHFREDVVDGTMQFDYRLRPGPSPTTNALKIMQLEGLPVIVDKP